MKGVWEIFLENLHLYFGIKKYLKKQPGLYLDLEKIFLKAHVYVWISRKNSNPSLILKKIFLKIPNH